MRKASKIYDDDLYEYDLTAMCNKTLRPYVLSCHFKDPEGREIEDSAVLDWLKYYDMLQTDICALGNDAAATTCCATTSPASRTTAPDSTTR